MEDEKRIAWNKEHQKEVKIIALASGIVLPVILFLLGAIISVGSFSFPLGKSYPLSEIAIIGIMLAIIAGDYLGRTFSSNNQTVIFLLSFFITCMVLIGIGESPIFFLVIVLTVVVGVMEYIDIIKLQEITGTVLKYARKFFISFLGGTVNFISINPVLKVYIGSYSAISWLLVLLLIVLIWKEQLKDYVISFLSNNMKINKSIQR